MTKKLRISLCIVFAFLLLLLSAVMVGCGDTDKGNTNEYGEVVVKSGMIRTEYAVGDELEITGGVLEFTQNEKTTHVAITESMISNFSTERAGSFTMIVTYKGNTTTVGYTVYEGFDMSKVYKSTDPTVPTIWIKFDTQSKQFYFAQGLATIPTNNYEWEQYGSIGTYTKSFKNNVLCLTLVVGSNSVEIKTINRTSFTLYSGGSLVLVAVDDADKAFDMTKIYKSTDSTVPTIWIKFDTQTEKFYFAQGLAAAPTTEEEWATYGAIGTYTKNYNDGILCVTATVTNPDSSTVTAQINTINNTTISFSDGQMTITLSAVE